MLYSQSFIESLRSHFLVSEVVGRRVPLKRHGREYMGLCPFHKEKTPSFTVNDEKGFYHCFGCGAHGDAIGFVKEYEGVSYREAIERLANEAGMALPMPTREERENDEKRKGIQYVVEAACAWFESQLVTSQGYEARDYLAQRGLREETLHAFRVGYAPPDRDALARALIAEGITVDQMVAAGLLIKPDGKAAYSRFRGRVMFPIRDKHSRVVAFGGRILPRFTTNDTPKYLNSPETELFKKGQMLYNFDLARKSAYDLQAILVCEGYTDVISLHQAGLTNAVAPLGTAVTSAQLQQLWQVCDAPAMCLDGDAAGERAMQRVSELALPLLMPGKTLAFVRLPQGEDPDSLVRSGGVEALREMMGNAPKLADVLWQQVTRAPASTPEEKARQEHRLMQLADQIQDPTVKSHFRAYFKQKFWSKPEVPMARVGKVQMARAAAQKVPHLPRPQDAGNRLDKAARACLHLIVLYPQMLRDAEVEEFVACMALARPQEHALRQTVLNTCAMQLELTRKELIAHLGADAATAACLNELQAEHALRVSSAMLKDEDAQHLLQAKRYWRQALNAYHTANLLEEYQQAEQEMSHGLSDETTARLLALKAQLEQMHKEHEMLLREEMQDDAMAS